MHPALEVWDFHVEPNSSTSITLASTATTALPPGY
jgi:hypothetical protein